ncbi:E3 ubiquitin-protein ligase APD2-like isoform X2 [Aristolochia californica]|uniref:E3 ubiquitin-protein ligase APD2-like isoform X2 n=1 Tax=Aristolochia californica TaxID=171875 RepID=UPI0035D8FC5C
MEESALHGDPLPPSFPFPASDAAGSSSSLPAPLSSQEPEHERRERSVTYRVNISVSNQTSSAAVGDEAWSCVVVLVSFWFFAASMTLILGFYGSVNLHLGPNCSRLIHANSLFVQGIQVRVISEPKAGPMLYDFSSPPSLDVKTNWSEYHMETVAPNFHKEWIYYLNKGSQVNVSYFVKSTSSSPLSLVIAEGKENLIEWLEDPSYPDTTLSWNLIHGNGLIQQKIFKTSDYYIAVGNLNSQEVEVQLNFSIQAVVYNTTGAYKKCALDNRFCLLKLLIFGSNVAVLTSPGTVKNSYTDGWFVKLSYVPRWMTYIVGSGSLTAAILLVVKILAKCQRSPADGSEYQEGTVTTERTPLLAQKDDDVSSLGSSYDSVSHDEEEFEDLPGTSSVETKSIKEGEPNYPRRQCEICFNAPRDCFFLPCGHCATCFTCGTRIAEEAGICPICRRKMKKVRKIFTV